MADYVVKVISYHRSEDPNDPGFTKSVQRKSTIISAYSLVHARELADALQNVKDTDVAVCIRFRTRYDTYTIPVEELGQFRGAVVDAHHEYSGVVRTGEAKMAGSLRPPMKPQSIA